MKKRVLSLFMALALCLTLLPTAALAETAGTARDGEPAGGVYTVGEDTAAQGEAALDEAVRAAQALIDALPEEATADNADELQARLIALDAALDALTDEQLAALDTARYEALCAALAALTAEQAAHSHALCTHGSGCTVCPPEAKQSQTFAKALTMGLDGVLANGVELTNGNGEVTLNAGTYYLDQTISASKLYIEGNVVLCLNGNSFEAAQNGYCIFIKDGATLTLCDCKGGGKITHGSYNGNPFSGGGVSIGYSSDGEPVTSAGFILYSGSISGNTTHRTRSTDGGGVTVEENASFTMYGGSITGNTATNGGGVAVEKNASFTMYDGSITGNTADGTGDNASDGNGGGVNVGDKGTFTMYGGTIGGTGTGEGNSGGDDGGGVNVVVGGRFLMSGGEITGNTAGNDGSTAGSTKSTGYGGGVHVSSTGTFEMSGDAAVSGNEAIGGGDGGGVYISAGTFKMSGNAAVRGNAANGGVGGGVFLTGAYGSFTMADSAAICGNTSRNSGGGVYMGNGTFTMTGGSITGNEITGNGDGGVYMGGGTFEVSGPVQIKGNTNSSTNATTNVYLSSSGSITIGEGGLAESARIGVSSGKTLGTGDSVTVATGADNGYYAGNLFSDVGGGYGVLREGDDVKLYNVVPHKPHPICGAEHEDFYSDDKDDNNDHTRPCEAVTWTELTQSGGELYIGETAIYHYTEGEDTAYNYYQLNEGSYYLGGDITPDAPIRIDGSVNLCLNGHSITKTTDTSKTNEYFNGVISIMPGGSFSLCDCNSSGAGNGKITHAKGKYGQGVTGNRSSEGGTATFSMFGGEISGNTVTGDAGGGVYVTGGTFTMYGGKITGNTVTGEAGGGVCASGTFTMYGGEISGNTSTKRGGGIFASGSTKIYGGTISGNHATGDATTDGGGVYVNNAPLTLSGNAVITGNTATGSGGGVYYSSTFSSHKLTVSDTAEIKGNSAANGGGIYVGRGEVKLEGGTITENTATQNGGGVYYSGTGSYSPMTVSDTAEIKGNSAANGGGVYVNAGKVTLTGGTVGGAETGEGNSATSNGGGVYVGGGTFSMSDGSITGNSAEYSGSTVCSGGGVYVGDGAFDMSGGSVTKNTAAIGGGVYVSGGTFSMSENAKLTGNSATSSGGGVCVGGGTFTMTGGTVGGTGTGEGNSAKNGGGVYVASTGTFTMSDGAKITGNKAEYTNSTVCSGGGVYVSGGTFEMSGGSITGNSATGSTDYYGGGGVFVDGSGTFTMTGGTVGGTGTGEGNSAQYGGGVYVKNNNSTFNMSGTAQVTGNSAQYGGGVYVGNGKLSMSENAEITGNSADKNGGGVCVSSGKLTMSQTAQITGNSADQNGGGVYKNAGSGDISSHYVYLSDGVQIKDNWKNGTWDTSGVYKKGSGSANNLYLASTHWISITGKLADGASIGVTTADTPTEDVPVSFAWYADGVTADTQDDKRFTSDASSYDVALREDGSGLRLKVRPHVWTYKASGATITAKCSDCDASGGSVTITAPDADDRTYDGNAKKATLTVGGATVSSVTVGGATASEYNIDYREGDDPNGNLPAGTYPKNAGTYTASITVGEGSNKVTASVTYTIERATPKASDFRFTAPTDLTYDGGDKTAYVWTAAGITGMDSFMVDYYDSMGRNVTPTNVLPGSGVYTVKITVGENGTNYTSIRDLTDESWTFAIKPRPVTVTVDAVSRAYGEQNPTFTAQVTGGSLADDESIEDLNLLLTCAASSRMPVGAYDVTCLSSNINYDVTADGAGKLTVTPKYVSILGIKATNKTYDGTTDAALDCSNANILGTLPGDEVTVDITNATASFADADVGTGKRVTLAGLALGGASAGNYALTVQPACDPADITPATLTVTPDGSQHKTYGEADPAALTYTCSGAARGETPAFTGKLARELGENAGSYAITSGDLALADGEGFKANNYTLAFSDTEVMFTIDKASYGNRTASGSARFGSSGTVDLSSLIAEGGSAVISTSQSADPENVLDRLGINGGTLSFAFEDDSSKVGATATIGVLVRNATNYENYTITVTVTVDDKITPTLDGAVTLSPAAITYGEPLSTIAITGTMKAGETVVEGTFAWQNPDAVLSARTHNDIAWTFTPLDTNAYAGASGTATVTVNKAAQSGTVRMASYTYGTAPSAPTLENRTGDPSAAVSYYCAKEGSASTQEWNVSNPPELDAGTYRMYASIAETRNYYRGNADYCEFTVWKAAPTYATKPTGLTAKYGQTLGTVALVNPEGNTPGTWSWQTPETVLDQLGTLSYDANFRPDDTDNYLGVVDVSIQVTVGPADGGSLGTATLAQKYTDGSERTYTPDWSGLPAGQVWSYSSGYSVSAGSSAALTRQDVAADGSSLTYAISGGAAGDVVTITLRATCSNYEDFTITLVITLTEKDEQAALRVTGGSTVVYGQTLALGTSGGSGSGAVTYTVVNGTGEATIDANGVLTPVRVGSVTVTAHKAGDSGYNAASSAPFTVTITQATPTGAPKYTAITSGGKTLDDAGLTLTGSTLSPNAGTLVWVDADGSVLPDTTVVEANKSYSWRFTPDDPNYTSLTGSVVPYPVSYGGGGSAAAGITVPVTGSRDTVHISASVSNGTAEVAEIERSELEKVGTDSGVTIDLSGLDKGVTGVTLPKDTIRSISESAADGVTIKLPNAELRVDQKTLASAAEQAKGDRVQLVVESGSRAKSTMTDAQKQALDGMKNAAALEAYFVSGGQRIRDFNGGEVELSIPYQASGAIRAWYLKEDGTREPVSARYDKENARLILRHFSHYVIEELESGMGYAACAKDDTCPLAAFADLVPTAWYHDGVHYCIENGLMQGVSAASFLPNGSTTRAQLVTILWRLEGSPETAGAESFTDVKDGAWYAQAVRWAADRGVVKGYDNGGFGPDDAVTREQMVTILYRYAQYKGYDVSVGEDTNILSFNDALAVSGYAVPAMQWACGSGLVTGIAQDGGMALAPKDTTTRVQTATLMMRFYTECAR